MSEGEAGKAKKENRDSENEMSEAEIDANLEGTFPASDPPSWTLGIDHSANPPEADESSNDEEVE